VPVRVTGVVVPRRPEFGLIERRVGVPGLTTVNTTGLVTVPAVALTTVTFLAVSAAVPEMVKVAVIVVSLTTVKPLTVTPPPPPPPPLLTLIPVEPVKPMPVRVTGTLVPAAPVVGEIEVRLPGGMIRVNVTALVVPAGVVTVTFLAMFVVEFENMSDAVTDVSLTTVTAVTATPPPDTLTAVAPVNPLPVRVIGMSVPRLPEVGLIEVSTGPVMVYGRVFVSPPPVRTKMLIAPSGVALVLMKVALICVALT